MTFMMVPLPATYNDTYIGGINGNELYVKSGKINISKITNEHATATFNNALVKLGATALLINGSATCEIE